AEYDAKLLVSLLLQAKVNDPDTRPKVEIAAEKPLPFNGEGGKGGGRGGNRGRGRNDRRGGGGYNRDKRGGGRDRDDRNKKDYYKKDKQKVHPKATEKKPGYVIRNKGDK
ncbi:MAG: ATP-dependent RNA helicase, partial [Lactococcus raffinolactis]